MLQFPEMQGYMKKISFLAKSRFFRKNRVFKRRWNFCKKNFFFHFFLHFQILSHKTKLKGNCNFSLGIYFWQENQMLKDIFLQKKSCELFSLTILTFVTLKRRCMISKSKYLRLHIIDL